MVFKMKEEKIGFLNELEFGVRSKYIFVSPKNGDNKMYCVKFLWTTANAFLSNNNDYWPGSVRIRHKAGIELLAYVYKNERGEWGSRCALSRLPDGFDLNNIFHNDYLWADDPIELYKSLDSYEKDVNCKTQILMYLSKQN